MPNIRGTRNSDNLAASSVLDRLLGLQGNDTLFSSFDTSQIFGGTGEDTIIIDYDAPPQSAPNNEPDPIDFTVSGGNNDDVISVSATFDLGESADVSPSISGYIDGGRGNDNISVDLFTNWAFDTSNSGPTDLIIVDFYGDNNIEFLNSNNRRFTIESTSLLMDLGDGNDSVEIDEIASSYESSEHIDVYLGNGINTLNASILGTNLDLLVEGGDHVDTIDLTIEADGFNTADARTFTTVHTFDGDDNVFLKHIPGGTGNYSRADIDLGEGNNYLEISGTTVYGNTHIIKSGSGNDIVTLDMSANIYDIDSVSDPNFQVHLGDGNNHFIAEYFNGYYNTILEVKTGTGEDFVDLQQINLPVDVTLGDGDDELTIGTTGGEVTLGDGADILEIARTPAQPGEFFFTVRDFSFEDGDTLRLVGQNVPDLGPDGLISSGEELIALGADGSGPITIIDVGSSDIDLIWDDGDFYYEIYLNGLNYNDYIGEDESSELSYAIAFDNTVSAQLNDVELGSLTLLNNQTVADLSSLGLVVSALTVDPTDFGRVSLTGDGMSVRSSIGDAGSALGKRTLENDESLRFELTGENTPAQANGISLALTTISGSGTVEFTYWKESVQVGSSFATPVGQFVEAQSSTAFDTVDVRPSTGFAFAVTEVSFETGSSQPPPEEVTLALQFETDNTVQFIVDDLLVSEKIGRTFQDEFQFAEAGVSISASANAVGATEARVSMANEGISVRTYPNETSVSIQKRRIEFDEELNFNFGNSEFGLASSLDLDLVNLTGSGSVDLEFFNDGVLVDTTSLIPLGTNLSYASSANFDSFSVSASGSMMFAIERVELTYSGNSAPTALYRVNVGGETVAAVDGLDWEEDVSANPSTYLASAGSNSFASNSTVIKGPTVPDYAPTEIFETARWDVRGDENLSYSFEVTAGESYRINLFAGNDLGAASEPGERIFDVSVEGSTPAEFDDIDLSAQFGHLVGGMLSYDLVALDNQLDIEFLHDAARTPVISAIEILSIDDIA